MTTVTANTTLPHSFPEVRRISVTAPFAWLRAGWDDLRKAPAASLSVGLAITALAAVALIAASGLPLLFATIASGFFLIAPVLAGSFYEMSRRFQAGEPVRVRDAFGCCRDNIGNAALFGLFLALVFAAWARLTNLSVALALPALGPVTTHIDPTLLASNNGAGLIALYAGIGAVLAAFVYSLSVVSLPLMAERRVDVVTAAVTSLRAVKRNPLPLALWAVLIVGATLLGAAAGFIGLAVAMPILGHASWHAYRAMVAD